MPLWIVRKTINNIKLSFKPKKNSKLNLGLLEAHLSNPLPPASSVTRPPQSSNVGHVPDLGETLLHLVFQISTIFNYPIVLTSAKVLS